jgi:hypothetical protein
VRLAREKPSAQRSSGTAAEGDDLSRDVGRQRTDHLIARLYKDASGDENRSREPHKSKPADNE